MAGLAGMANSLTPFQLGSLLFVTVSLATGQVLFKAAAQLVVMDLGLLRMARSLLTWQFVLAIGLYGLGAMLWVLVLTSVPLSRAYPFIALGFVIVPLASHLVFNEPLGASYWPGVGILLVGLYVIMGAQGAD